MLKIQIIKFKHFLKYGGSIIYDFMDKIIFIHILEENNHFAPPCPTLSDLKKQDKIQNNE